MEYEEESNNGFYTLMYLVLGVLIVGLSGFIIYTLINQQSPDAGVSDNNTNTTVANKLTDQISNSQELKQFKQFLTNGGVYSTLGTGTYTVLAPIDGAFASLFDPPSEQSDTSAFVKLYIIEGKYDLAQLTGMAGQSVKTLNGDSLKIELKEDVLTFIDTAGNEASLYSRPAEPADNGQLFFIDRILFPSIPAEN